jgi:hypothetical protein
MILDKQGMGIEIKKGWLKVLNGEYQAHDDGLILIWPAVLDSNKWVKVDIPHEIKLHGKFSALIHYNPELYQHGLVIGPNFLNGQGGKISFRFKQDSAGELQLMWLVKLEIIKL